MPEGQRGEGQQEWEICHLLVHILKDHNGEAWCLFWVSLMSAVVRGCRLLSHVSQGAIAETQIRDGATEQPTIRDVVSYEEASYTML